MYLWLLSFSIFWFQPFTLLVRMKMSEKLFLQWNDLQDKIKGAFENLRDDKDFTDVTLACEDIFERSAIQRSLGHCVFSLNCGEANVFQENLDSFLAIAEELQPKGFMGRSDEKN